MFYKKRTDITINEKREKKMVSLCRIANCLRENKGHFFCKKHMRTEFGLKWKRFYRGLQTTQRITRPRFLLPVSTNERCLLPDNKQNGNCNVIDIIPSENQRVVMAAGSNQILKLRYRFNDGGDVSEIELHPSFLHPDFWLDDFSQTRVQFLLPLRQIEKNELITIQP